MREVGTVSRWPAGLLMPQETADEVFDEEALARLREVVDLTPGTFATVGELAALQPSVRVLLTGWGSPSIAKADLEPLAELRAIVHTAGSIKRLIDPDVLGAGIVVSSQAEINARPVAEFTFAMIVLALKRFSRFVDQLRTSKRSRNEYVMPRIGTAGARIGLVGASRVARALLPLLAQLDARVAVADPYLRDSEAAQLGVSRVELPELFATSDVVAVLAPLTSETEGMITAELLATLPDGAAVVNTARGPIIDHEALTLELVSGRIDAYLDVTDPEPLPGGSPLYRLPNVVLTPHIAGSLGTEVHALGRGAVAEVEALVAGAPMQRRVESALLARIA